MIGKICKATLFLALALGMGLEKNGRRITRAEHELHLAEDKFLPWFTGPLLTGGSRTLPPGHINVEGYIYGTNKFGHYTSNRKAVSAENEWKIFPIFDFAVGLTHWMDMGITVGAESKFKGNQSSIRYADTFVSTGYQVFVETPNIPSIKIGITERFPTGHYQNLNPEKKGVDSSGIGGYHTIASLHFQKVFYKPVYHPYRLRLVMGWFIPNNRIDVEGFNEYGGGYGTKGEITRSGAFGTEASFEVSLTQQIAVGWNVLYYTEGSSTFKGTPGITKDGSTAKVGYPSSDALSMAPAFEYSFTANKGVVAAVWFSVTGRNSDQFVTGIVAYTHFY